MTTKKVRIVGDKWPPQSNTYCQIDCTKSLKDVLDDLAKDLAVEKSFFENDSVFCRAIEGGKMGAPIKLDEVLDMVAAKPILFIRKKPPAGGVPASPSAKPAAKVIPKPGAKPAAAAAAAATTTSGAPPPPPGAKTASPKTLANSPLKKMVPAAKPGSGAKIPPPPPPKPGAKVPAAAAAAAAAPSKNEGDDAGDDETTARNDDESGNDNKDNGGDGDNAQTSNNKDNDGDDFDATAAAGKFAGAMKSTGGNATGTGRGGGGGEDSDDESAAAGAGDDESRSSSATPIPTTATGTSASSSGTLGGAKKPSAAKMPAAPTAKAAPPNPHGPARAPHPEAVAAPAAATSSLSILTTSGNPAGMDNVAAALAAQRSVDERLLQLQKSLVDEEKKRIEQYEVNLRHALAAEVDSIKQQLNASMQEERARSMQVQAVLEEQRTQLLKALVERDGQLQLAQGALQEAVTLGGKQAGPALAAIATTTGGAAGGFSSSTSELAREMQSQNDQLKKLLQAKDADSKNAKNANRAELDAMIRAQTQLVSSIDQLHAATSPPPSAVDEQKKDLASFLASVGLSRFTSILQKQDIDIEILMSMSDDELQRAGVDTVGARKRILLEFTKHKQHLQQQQHKTNQPQQLQVAAANASRELFAPGGSPAGAAVMGMMMNQKKSVAFGQNTYVPPPQPPAATAATSAGSPTISPRSGSPAFSQQQAQRDAQQSVIQAAQLTPELQDHHRVLHQLFRRAGAADWLARSAEMVDSFKNSLPALYEAVCSKLGVPAPNYQPGTGAFALNQFISRRFDHLKPAIDVMAFLADGREAEFADTMMLRQLKIGPQRLVWFCVPVAPSKAPEFAEDTADGKEKLYFYSALSKMSQWKRPTLFPEDKPVPRVVLPPKPLDDAIPSPGDKLSPNPQVSRVGAHRATDQQFIAATLSLLMRKDPSKLSQFPEFCRAYERKVQGADGQSEGKINYKGMYLDALQAYGPDDD